MTDDVLIRLATPRDLLEIIALWRALQDTSTQYEARLAMNDGAADWFTEFLREQMANGSAAIFVAVSPDKIVGYIFGQVLLRPTLVSGDCGYVADLIVSESERGQGIGRRLYETLRDWFRARGLRAIEVQVVRANPSSQAFWRKMGFGDFLRTLRNEFG